MIALCPLPLGSAGEALLSPALEPQAEVEAIIAAGHDAEVFRVPDAHLVAGAVVAVLDCVASDLRLPRARRMRIGWGLVRRLVKA